MIWPFKRKRNPPASSMPPINEDWQVGDLALHVEGTAECTAKTWPGGVGPAVYSIHRVEGITTGRISTTGAPGWGLRFDPWPGMYFHAACFRKIRPDAGQCEADFGAIIKSLRRNRAPAGADQ